MSEMGTYFSDLDFGDIQVFEKMSVIPLICPDDQSSVYLTLKEALNMNLLSIHEVDNSGSVPELKAINKSELPVLILDGEELIGAKQNRVLNASILLKNNSETIIPVSCTEQGRWSYNSDEFHDEGSVIKHSIRMSKRSSVSQSLDLEDNYMSDQSSIWNGIRDTIKNKHYDSPTSAHRDIYENNSSDINKYVESFDLSEEQIGVLVSLNGDIVGIDTVSSPVAYKVLHDKIIKSYAIEAALKEKKKDHQKFNKRKVKSFIFDINHSKESKYKSIGHGWDHRFISDSVLGSALICQDEIVHASFFKNVVQNDYDNMSSLGLRRIFRQ